MIRPELGRRLGKLRLFFGLIVLLLVQFALLRAGLVGRTWETGAATAAQLRAAFITGVRFDLATASYVLIPVAIACFIPWTAPDRGPRQRRRLLWAITVVVGLLSFLLLCEYEFFREFRSRYNQLAVRYLNQPSTVGGMLWYNYPVLRYVAVGIGAAALFHLGLRLVFRLAYPPRPAASESAESDAAPAVTIPDAIGTAPPSPWRPRLLDASLAFVMFATIVIGVRGGLGPHQLNWGDAFGGDSEYANQMSLNGVYSLSAAIRDMTKRGNLAAHDDADSKADQTEVLREARKTVQAMVVAPGERLLDPDRRTVFRVGDPGSRIHLKTASGKPVNVVMVLMESFSAQFVGVCGAERSFTPGFDAVAKGGTLFDRTFSAGTHTHQGIFTTQLGFPNLPRYESLMDSSAGNQEFMSAAEIFHRRGYQTMFLYNGTADWDNMDGFLRKQGVDTVIGRPQMEAGAKYVDKVWGVADGDVFDRANKEFDAAAKRGPFFATVLTLSNHSPFQVPSVPGLPPVTDQGDLNGRMTAMEYADWAFGQFIEGAKKLDYYKDTLFVFVGDHGFHVPPVLTELHLLYHHVPLVFYAPGLVKTDGTPGDALAGGVDHRVATHMSIIPSIMGLIGATDTPESAWGRSLFNDGFPDDNFAVIKQTGGTAAIGLIRDDKLMITYSASGKPLLFQYSLGSKPSATPLNDPALRDSMQAQLRAFVRSGLDDLTSHRAGPPDAGKPTVATAK